MMIERGRALSSMQAMARAIEVAKKGLGFVSPNPLVGAVLLNSQGRFVSEGAHEFFGGPHAEVNALREISWEEIQGGQLFVTLEPCAHEGKTPSCAKYLSKLPLKKVIYGLVDPNPLVQGKGARILEEAGIQAELCADLQGELEQLCEVFLCNQKQKTSFVAVKIASSLDGRVALSNGESRWITNAQSREKGHELRAAYDATLIGVGTFLSDNPRLDIRHPRISKKNRVMVLDPQGRGLLKASDSNLLKTHAAEDIYWFVGEGIDPLGSGVRVERIPLKSKGSFDLMRLMQRIWDLRIYSVLVEGGGTTQSRFIESGLVHRIHLFLAPTLLGQDGGRGWTESFGIASMAQRRDLNSVKVESLAQDVYITGLLHRNL